MVPDRSDPAEPSSADDLIPRAQEAREEARRLQDEAVARTAAVRAERAAATGLSPGLSPDQQHEERHRQTHEAAADAHERAAGLHEDAAVFFEAHDEPEKAAAEIEAAVRDRGDADDDQDIADSGA